MENQSYSPETLKNMGTILTNVKSPIHFFVVVLLVVNAILGAVIGFESEHTILIFLVLSFVMIITILAYTYTLIYPKTNREYKDILSTQIKSAGIVRLLSQEEAPSQRIPDIIKNYNRIGFLGIAFSNIVPSICTSENAEILKDRLCKTDFNFEILFLRPFSNLAEMRRKELKFIDPSSNISRNARQIQEFKESVIKEIPSNKQIEAKTRFRVLFYNVMPKHAITRLNDELCVSPYFISEKGAESHFLMLLKRPGYLYEKYLKYYEDVLNNFSKGFEDVELLDQNVCPHAILCKNFKIFSRQECDYCGETITGHHLHDLAKGFRLCYTCTKLLISGDLLEKYNPRFSNLNEKKICTNFKNCFNGKDFILFHDKKCEKCGAATGDIHFHDVNQNIRLCINCLKNRLE